MIEAGSVFAPDAYVVRYGGRAVLGAIGCLLGGLAIIVFVVLEHNLVVAVVIALIIALVLLGVAGADLGKVAGREVAFAVHQGGVYFGSETFKDNQGRRGRSAPGKAGLLTSQVVDGAGLLRQSGQ